MELNIISPFISVVMSLGIVLVTYVKTWVRLDTSVQNLSNVVDKLGALLENITNRQTQIMKEQSVMNTEIKHIVDRIEKIEVDIEKIEEDIDKIK